jgi:hypothetical protein
VSQPQQSAVRNRLLKVLSPDDSAPLQPHMKCFAREFVQGIVQSATARGAEPAARLQQFRALQQAAIAMSQDPSVVRAAEQLVPAIDLALQELAPVKS